MSEKTSCPSCASDDLRVFHRAKGVPVNSCMVLGVECDGAEIITVEGLARDGQLDPVQQAIMEAGGVQCGFCTPGMLMAGKALLESTPRPSEEEVKFAIAGNLCRCTGYKKIVKAICASGQGEDE